MNLKSRASVGRRLAQAAPVVGLSLMLILPVLLSYRAGDTKAILARNAQVVTVCERAPYKIGEWVGEDIEIPPAAVDILRPNAILSRRYRRLESNASAELLVVHCSDARDMQGHYPPICYPASGWLLSGSDAESECILTVGGQKVAMRVYEFHRMEGWGSERSLRVFNYFLMPDGETTSKFSDLSRLPVRYPYSLQGIAQVQVITSGDWSFDGSLEAVRELLTGVSDLLLVLTQGDQRR